MNESEFHTKITVTSDAVLIELGTQYGPITFSYTPSAIGEGITKLAADILQSKKTTDETTRGGQRLGFSSEQAREAAQVFEERARQTFPQDAIEKFSPSSGAYTRGLVEQFSDNLVPALILMLDYLAAAALVSPNSDSEPNWTRKIAADQEATRTLLEERFGESIRALWTPNTESQ